MIELEQVSLHFPGKNGFRLRDRLAGFFGGARAELEEDGVRALHEISLTISKGERVGVIGWNGAGKTTLLKTMCGIYTPTTGRVSVQGDVASLFELATGFEMEASGFDNMLALLLGMSYREAQAAMPAIAEFTELGAALERPVKTYSFGMFLRLAFAVSTAIQPDVLLLDEIVAAGDARFQAKAQRRLDSMVENASLVVLISHDMATIRAMSDRCIWIEAGEVREDGPTDAVIRAYAGAVA
jgi:ABC-type polysaccharide/polyol phosphate transport system ATPase subunit